MKNSLLSLFWEILKPSFLYVFLPLIFLTLLYKFVFKGPISGIYKFFTSREELDLEGVVISMEDPDPAPMFPFFGYSGAPIMTDCYLSIKDNKGQEFFVSLDRPLFYEIRELWKSGKQTIKLHCSKCSWNQMIHVKTFV